MVRKKPRVSAEERLVRISQDANISSAANTPKPRHRKNAKPILSRSQQSAKVSMASQDTSEVDSRPVKRQKSDADAGAKQQETDDATTTTAPKEEHSVTTGEEHEQKHDSSADNKHEGPLIGSAASTEHQNSGATQDSNPQLSITPVLDPEAQCLQDKYNITFMPILSSSQVGQKISNLNLNAVQPEKNEDGTKSLAGVVVASAKGSVISKLVTIVERFMRATNKDGNIYYVYCSLKGVKEDKKSKPGKRCKALRGFKQEDVATGPTTSEDMRKSTANGDDKYASYDTDGSAFETMGHCQIVEKEQNPKKMHVVPCMTMYISRVPLPGLKAFSRFVILSRKKRVNQLTFSHAGNKLTLSRIKA